jgi:hypothetical protein
MAFTTTNNAPVQTSGTLAWKAIGSYVDGVNLPTGNAGPTQEYWMWETRTVKD